jgi:hypothetical protein
VTRPARPNGSFDRDPRSTRQILGRRPLPGGPPISVRRGTPSSNPVSSSGESLANLIDVSTPALTRPYCAVTPCSGSSAALVQAYYERNCPPSLRASQSDFRFELQCDPWAVLDLDQPLPAGADLPRRRARAPRVWTGRDREARHLPHPRRPHVAAPCASPPTAPHASARTPAQKARVLDLPKRISARD